MHAGAPGKVGLFDSSVPEPSTLLAETTSRAFRFGLPSSFQSVFMRSNPVLAAQLAERYGVSQENVICTTGATTALSMIYQALLSPGEEVLVERPGFDIFANFAKHAGLDVAFFDRPAPEFQVSVDEVIGELKDTTRMVVISNLHNPSGVCIPLDTLERLAIALEARNVTLLIDEVYQDYAVEGCQSLNMNKHKNVIRIGSMTKNFGLNALRCGWVFAAGEIQEKLRKYFNNIDFGVSKFSHAVASEVLSQSDVYDTWRTRIMDGARPVAEAAISKMVEDNLLDIEMPLIGCTCFPRVPGVSDTRALSGWLISHHGVVVVPGECFGIAGHIRIGFAHEEMQLKSGLERLAKGLAEYRRRGESAVKKVSDNVGIR